MRLHKWVGWLRTLFGISATLLLLYQWLQSPRPLRTVASTQPAGDYAEALQHFERLRLSETGTLHDICRSQLLTHGQPTPRVFVLLHGYTNCPQQFAGFAQLLHQAGHNVLNVRVPRHGFADPLSEQPAFLTAEEMVDVTNEVLDLAAGLGTAITVIGMSLGGVLAGWAAQYRADVDQAVLLAPALGLQSLSPQRSQLIANLLALIPNRFLWWNPTLKAERIGPAHVYPRFSTRGVAAFLQVACLVRKAAQQHKPAGRAILLITNPWDNVVDNATALEVVHHWRSHGAAVDCREFPAEWHLIHDVLDAAQPGQQIERVYPLLLEWITAPHSSPIP